MKKALVPILAIIAIAAIVLCFVFNGQKADLEKQIPDLQKQIEDLKDLMSAYESGLIREKNKK